MSLINRIDDFLDRQKPWAVFAVCLTVVAAVGVVDYFSGTEVTSSLFYLLPILVAAWYAGSLYGLIVSVLSAASLVTTDAIWGYGATDRLVLTWTYLAPLGFFVVFVMLLDRLKAAFKREQALSRTDTLTGLNNRRFFCALAEFELERARRYDHPFGLAYLDLDNFKQVNDTCGHDQGDEVLKLASTLMQESLRANDIIGRLGGDEFAVLLPEADPASCALVAHRLKASIADAMKGRGWPVTASIGLVAFLEAPVSVDEMLKEGDRLMYEVKQTGKNSIDMEVVG
ncbi:MAG: diguanylate cyclase [Actinobacteria bacterium]|nr:diguanylate cyclase [Actinomycetota bacterium]MBU1944280.1 diguanylate cyclase [Actinomycetota bacterium]MBU2688256.1 diguanylate cyclase [Actinomycetota bacterium]